jgi:hypothetical protein
MFAAELQRTQEEKYHLLYQHENDMNVIDSLHHQLEREALYCQVNHADCCPVQKIQKKTAV